MSKKPKTKTPTEGAAPQTLATVLAALEGNEGLSETRKRDLRSAVKRVAVLLANDPARIILDLSQISVRLAAISPVAVGMTAKRFANIRSDFVAGVKASGLIPEKGRAKTLSSTWAQLFANLSTRRAHLGLSRFARYASARGLDPHAINDTTVSDFIAAVREQSLHRKPNHLHRQVTQIWNEAARDPALGLQLVQVASFRPRTKRVDWDTLTPAFRQELDRYLSWCSGLDPFATDARVRPLAPRSLKLRRDQVHAAISALVKSGIDPDTILSLADLVTPDRFKGILRCRLEDAGGKENFFNHTLGVALLQVAREWVKVDAAVLVELKRLLAKMPVPLAGLTGKNKRFLRQFNDPRVLRRLAELPDRLWAEVRRDSKPGFRTLAKAHAALAIAILMYMPVRMQNLAGLIFDTHLFIQTDPDAISTLELNASEVKNRTEVAFDIPPRVARMLVEYRERLAPKIIGERPGPLFANIDGTAKDTKGLANLIAVYAKRRAGIELTPHQFRHLSAKVLLDAHPGAFETVKQVLNHKSGKTTVNAYAGFDSRRAGRHHQRLIENALASRKPAPLPSPRDKVPRKPLNTAPKAKK